MPAGSVSKSLTYSATHINYKPTIKKFLNTDMEKYRFISDKDAAELRNAFKNTVAIINSLLGEHAFKRFNSGHEKQRNGSWEKTAFNASLYDILMDTFARIDKNKVFQNLDAIKEAYIDLMTSDLAFIYSIERSTSASQAVKMRFEKWRSTLQGIFDITQKEPRCFSYELKEILFNKNSTCDICNQQISSIDDSAVDHIQQYWTGGKTIPENARLTHRYCNNSRDRVSPGTVIVPAQNPIPTRPRTSRQRTIVIEGEKILCKNAVAVLITTANWLIKKGKISALTCPIKLSNKGTGYLINTEAHHEDGRKFQYGGAELLSNLHIDKNWPGETCIEKARELLIYCGIPATSFDLG